jgi:hypothetical protein
MSAFIPNSFQVTNDYVDHAMSKVSPVATVLYLLIVRKTRGWQKQTDQISISQFMLFSGVKSRSTVARAVTELVDIGLIDEIKNPKGNFYRISDEPLSSLKNGLVQKIDQPASPKNGPVDDSASLKIEPALVQKMDSNQSKNWTSASPKNGHTENNLLKQENKLLKQEKSSRVFEDQKSGLAETIQRESPKPPESLPTVRGRLKPNHSQASVQTLNTLSPAVSQFYQDLRRLCVDLSVDDPCLALAGSKQANQLAMTVLHMKTNGGFIRAMWYTLAEMGLAEQVAA